MNTAYFQRMKQDFLDTYRKDLCEDSLDDIHNANDVDTFIAILHKYLHFLKYKFIPTIDWARKWFLDYTEEINAHGVYLDQIVTITDHPSESVVLLGKCRANVFCTEPKTTYFTLQDESKISVFAYNYACCVVRLTAPTTDAMVMQQSPYAHIKIRRL